MMKMILEILGELFLSSKKVKPWVKTAFVCTILLALTLVLCWGVYMDWTHGGCTVTTVLLAAFVAAVLALGFRYVWKCHKNNWQTH